MLCEVVEMFSFTRKLLKSNPIKSIRITTARTTKVRAMGIGAFSISTAYIIKQNDLLEEKKSSLNCNNNEKIKHKKNIAVRLNINSVDDLVNELKRSVIVTHVPAKSGRCELSDDYWHDDAYDIKDYSAQRKLL